MRSYRPCYSRSANPNSFEAAVPDSAEMLPVLHLQTAQQERPEERRKETEGLIYAF